MPDNGDTGYGLILAFDRQGSDFALGFEARSIPRN